MKDSVASIAAAKLVEAEPNHCWQNAANLMFEDGYENAAYVEGVVVSPTLSEPCDHGWVLLNGVIIDPTLPEKDLTYFPAYEWRGSEFERMHFTGDKPCFKRMHDGKIEETRQDAKDFIARRTTGSTSAPRTSREVEDGG